MAGDNFYAGTVSRLSGGKDSIFEIGEITKFDSEKLTASVLGLRTKEVKENVIVTFPNLFMNSGIIPFPVNKTKGLLFVGPDNQNFFLPAQFHLPHMESDKGKAVLDSSPERIDPYINFSDFDQGELLLRHIKGSQMAFRNNGNLEITTDKANSFIIDSEEGKLLTVFDGKEEEIGYSIFKNMVSQNAPDEVARHTISAKVTEVGPKWKTNEIIRLKDALTLLKLEEFDFDIPEARTVFTFDFINVLDEDEEIIVSDRVDSELFCRIKINLDGEQEYYDELTKSGNRYRKWSDKDISKEEEESLQSKISVHTHRNNRKNKHSSVREERIVMYGEDGRKSEVSLTPSTAALKMTGSGEEKSVKIENNKVFLKNGQAEIEMTNGDIKFKTSSGSISIKDIISALRG